MPSFLKRFSTLKRSNSGSSQPTKSEVGKLFQRQQKQQIPTSDQHNNNSNINSNNNNNNSSGSSREEIDYELTQELAKRSGAMSNRSSISDSSSNSHISSPKASASAAITTSSTSSLSLYMPESDSSKQQSSDVSNSKAHRQSQRNSISRQHQQQREQVHTQNQQVYGSSSSSSSQASASPQTQAQAQQQSKDLKMKRGSMSSLSALFHSRSRSMIMLQDGPISHMSSEQVRHQSSTLPSPVLISQPDSSIKRASVDNFGSDSRRMSENFSSGGPEVQPNTPSTMRGKKVRPKSLSQLPGGTQPKSARWASRGGIGSKEMMVDLETTGVFVPSNGQRLRVEFVYRTVIQCADEIRSRGLDHINVFNNPSPKKVISAMIALMMDENRCDLYPIQFLRIDTVAGLMLNLLSQMSNPVIPYAIMEHYFKMGATSARSPVLSPSPLPVHRRSLNPMADPERSPSPISSLLPTIPALPPKGSSQATMTWAREYFDLPAFLNVLPSMNRVILLEVLHLCQELLDHQIWNRVSFPRLVEQIAPALFSTVFDQKILETMAGSRQCSIHGETISPEEGSRAENHLFSVILIRFLYLTAHSSNIATMSNVNCDMVEDDARNPNRESCTPVKPNVYGHNSAPMFRKSQELLQQEQQVYYERMARSYQEMEIQQRPPQHFGVYSASQKQQQQEQLQQMRQKEMDAANRSQEQIVPYLAVSMSAQAV
ncbi:hypothetical protein BGX27_009011 [Mortierella sp. AM989]|nr:hypothetical protein BGX27_009011 [Mortierella sp. AM989]